MGNISAVSYRMPQNILDSIDDERRAQDQKWGNQSQNTYPIWAAILTEEVGEVAQAVLKAQWIVGHDFGQLNWCKRCGYSSISGDENPRDATAELCPGDKARIVHLRAEIVQVAAVAVAWLEALDGGARPVSVMTGATIDA